MFELRKAQHFSHLIEVLRNLAKSISSWKLQLKIGQLEKYSHKINHNIYIMKVQWDNRGAKINIDKCVSNKQKAAVKDQRRWHMPSSHNVKNRKFTLFICNRDTISMEIRKGFVLLVWFSPPDKCKMHISLCDVAFSFSNSTNYSTRLCAAFYDVKNIISANQKKKKPSTNITF